jgi:hypothetical protein
MNAPSSEVVQGLTLLLVDHQYVNVGENVVAIVSSSCMAI